ncbi:MAG: IS21 family transposase [Gammaproteobacteria bacterium]|nr:MAG: IS21 family transposase [Gammaproteobacteria bacterium]QOJ31435.1 MAG: IS21 family transposase [Gammaproteobacteria bacterium]
MIDVAILSVIRRWHLREGVPIREIARRTKLSRNTIRKYLASGVVEPVYPQRKSPIKLDPFADMLACWLEREAGRGRKQRRNWRQLHNDLRALGYEGSYDRVAAFSRAWQRQLQEAERTSRGTFVPLRFAPGEAFQFDWSEDWAVIGGERCKFSVAQFKLCHSRAFLLRAYPQQSHEMLFDAHNHAFAVFGGVPRRGIYDNMKTAVDKIGRGKERIVNVRFRAMASHFLFETDFCNPAAGWEKGQIEKNVQDARPRIWHEVPRFPDLPALNDWLQRRCIGLWSQIQHPEHPQRTVAQVLAEEQPHLMPAPSPFDGYVEDTKRVSPTCLITFERNRYSVPASFANRPVSVRAYADRLVVVAEGQIIAEHARLFARDHSSNAARTVYDWRHYLAVIQRKPGALRNGAPFATFPEGLRRLQSVLLKRPGGDREMVEILALVLRHDEQAVLCAVELALDSGTVSKPHILNLLSRLLAADVPAPIHTPARLALQQEPEANVDRYDHLLGDRHVG